MAEVSLDMARQVKDRARKAAEAAADVAGVGLGKVGGDYVVKINLHKKAPAKAALPAQIDGVSIVYEVIGKITPR
ncbi:MAG TPA: hypothetical protein VGO52_21460 [Hyphomonadaceae bacterium]|jgi:hypothetical protein|nr:hypothetical protein [Hyphomonadaceae bacterium]